MIMTIKTVACTMTVTFLAGTASFAVPAVAQGTPTPPRHVKTSSIQSKKLFLSAGAVYDAGLRRGAANSSRTAYLRGFRDGASSEAYSSRGYVVDSSAGYSSAPVSGYYDRGVNYAPRSSEYSSYDGRSIPYSDAGGYVDGRYGGGSTAVTGLMDVVSAPMAATPYAARTAQWNYCTARYQSFDPATGTFLAGDGYRYYCR